MHNQLDKKAALQELVTKWADILEENIGQEKLAELYTIVQDPNKDKEEQGMSLGQKVMLGAAGLGLGAYVASKLHGNPIKSLHTDMMKSTDGIRSYAKNHLVPDIEELTKIKNSKFESMFDSVAPHEKSVVMQNVKDVEGTIDALKKVLPHETDPEFMALKSKHVNQITQYMSDNALPKEVQEHLIKRVENTFRTRNVDSFTTPHAGKGGPPRRTDYGDAFPPKNLIT